ncbi:PAS domain-containing sensor histidine kinase [Phenylobacterium sp. J367]|uniref:PAS domain-containing sensor histidine kinase n=1 Tax=Phenylobacterium sp. J367 TaxID=2898435 RepID=UPI0021519797|nr:HWE histidine kinase domain-containing protein [Phenylobacterium sp. J367]MCR5880933.1 PAS domain S-box protein [Phenylobacterium sp. J367]
MGRPFFEVWPEVDDEVGPVIESAYAGDASFFEDLPVTLLRQGAPHQAWFTFSYTPVEDEDGRIAGALCLCRETTEAVLAKQRAAFLLELEGVLRPLTEPREVIAAAQRALGEHLGANRVGYGDVAEDERFFTTEHNWTDGTVEHHSGLHDLAAFGPPVLEAMRHGVTLRVNDAATEPAFAGAEVQAAFAGLELKASLVVSLVKGGRLTAALYVHQSTPRYWSDDEARLVEEVAERTWSAVERARAEAELRRSEARYREFFETAGDAIFIEDVDGRYVEVNAAACRLIGYPRDELIGMDSRLLLGGDDVGPAATWRRTGGRDQPAVADRRLRRKDGSWVEVEISAGSLSNGGVEAVVRDISARRAAEARQRLMLNELNHRVKNSLATVQAIAAQTLQRADVPKDVRDTFAARLIALAQANDVLIAEDWSGAGLEAIAAQVASPHAESGRPERFSYGGPPVHLPPKSATAMALALHELATNAAKYGALSKPEGQVSLSWDVDPAAGEIAISWRERGGPPVSPPARSGFGTRLIRQGLKADLQAKVAVSYEPEGLVCSITAPLPGTDPGPLEIG